MVGVLRVVDSKEVYGAVLFVWFGESLACMAGFGAWISAWAIGCVYILYPYAKCVKKGCRIVSSSSWSSLLSSQSHSVSLFSVLLRCIPFVLVKAQVTVFRPSSQVVRRHDYNFTLSICFLFIIQDTSTVCSEQQFYRIYSAPLHTLSLQPPPPSASPSGNPRSFDAYHAQTCPCS
jgi:hypothetical protein